MENTNRINKQRIKQMKGWENMPDEFAEKMTNTLRRLSEIIYSTLIKHSGEKFFSEGALPNLESKSNAI